MCVAKVVYTDVEIQRGLDRRKPNVRSEGVARDWRPGFGREEELVSAETPTRDVLGDGVQPPLAQPNVRASLPFGYGLTIMRSPVGECRLADFDSPALRILSTVDLAIPQLSATTALLSPHAYRSTTSTLSADVTRVRRGPGGET